MTDLQSSVTAPALAAMTDLQPSVTAPALAAMNAYPFNFTLPSGKTGTVIRNLKGHDCTNAEMVVPDDKRKVMRSYALVAPVLRVDGKPVVLEDLLEMDIDDLGELIEKATGKAPTSTQKA